MMATESPMLPRVPIFMRVADGPEVNVGDLFCEDGEGLPPLPDLLRMLADAAEDVADGSMDPEAEA